MIGRILLTERQSHACQTHVKTDKKDEKLGMCEKRIPTYDGARRRETCTRRRVSRPGPRRCPRAQAPRRGHAAREEARTLRGLFPRRSARWARSSARVPSPRARWRGAATRRITSGSTPRGSRLPASASGTSAGGSPTTTRRTGVASPPHPSRQVRRGDFPSPEALNLESSREVESSPKRFAFFSSRRLERRVRDPLPSGNE